MITLRTLAASATTLLALAAASAQAVVVSAGALDVVPVERSATGTSFVNTTFPAAEGPVNAFDGSTATKYLNFQGAGLNAAGEQATNPTGLIVTLPSPSAINGIRFASANDFPSRDPSMVLIEGSNRFPTSAQYVDAAVGDTGADWTTVYSGPTGIVSGTPRLTFVDPVSFDTGAVYGSYRVTITDLVRVANNAPTVSQFSELELQLNPIPEPASLGLLGLGGIALLRRRRA